MGYQFPVWEFHQNNVRGEYTIDESKGLVERVYVESVNASGANEYMESIGANFKDYCHCCGARWYCATIAVDMERDGVDVVYSRERVAIHKIDGSFTIWTPKEYAAPKPEPIETSEEVERREVENKAWLRIEAERIAEANKPRYNALPPEEEMRAIAYAKAELLSAIDKNTARKAKAELLFAIREHMDGIYELIGKL